MKGADIPIEEKKMTFSCSRIARFSAVALLAWSPLFFAARPVEAADLQTPVNALYLLTVPSDYQRFEHLVNKCKGSGATTLIIRPVSTGGSVDKRTLAKAVFFAHAAGMKLYVILPTRDMTVLLDEHPDWEDMQYDLESGTIQPTGKVDLLNQEAGAYFSDFFRDIAGYSVDGILLDEDYLYREVEGTGEQTLERYKQKYGSSFSARAAFAKVRGDGRQDDRLDDYPDSFWNMAELKKENLLLLLKKIIKSSQSVNKEIKFGVPLPRSEFFLSEREMLARHSLDVTALKKMEAAMFWLAVRHRDFAGEDINHKKRVEIFSRVVKTSMSLANEPAKIIIGIQTTALSRKLLPIFEIEEISSVAKKAGEPGIAFMVESDTELPAALTKKIFRRQPE